MQKGEQKIKAIQMLRWIAGPHKGAVIAGGYSKRYNVFSACYVLKRLKALYPHYPTDKENLLTHSSILGTVPAPYPVLASEKMLL